MLEDNNDDFYAGNVMYDILNYNGLILIIVILISVIILIISEYVSHDCIPGKTCNHSVEPPKLGDSNDVYIDTLRDMVTNSYLAVSWRQALLVALIITPIIIYYLRGRFLTLWELLVVGLFIFLGGTLSAGWLIAHFYRPNGEQIEKSLLELRDKLNNNE